MAISEARFRHVLGHLAGGVAVVSSCDPEGGLCGLTATSVCSVSLDPPLVLVSIERDTNTHGGIRASDVYAINLLGAGSDELARKFASDAGDKFAGLPLTTAATGSPILEGVLGYCDCRVVQEVAAGDHTLFIGRVEAAEIFRPESPNPLVYHLGGYRSLRPPRE